MPKQLNVRLAEALNVSPAFDNCFFHSYAAHLLANKLPLPKDLFTFKSIMGPESPASKLQARFPSQEYLFLFEEYAHRHHPEQAPLSPNFIVEKTLVLGFLMREWFATQLAQNIGLADATQEDAVKYFNIYRGFRWDQVEPTTLLDGPNGCLYTANKAFLEFFVTYPDCELTTEQDFRFGGYFIEADGDADKALAAYWKAEGYQNYFRLIANPSAKLAYHEVVPVLKMLDQSLTIYDAKNSSVVYSHKGNEGLPEMELKLDATAAHYYLLKTDETEPLLKEYARSMEQYQVDRTTVLLVEGNKDLAAEEQSSLLVGAICPNGHLSKPAFTLLLDKVDRLQTFVHEHQRIQKQREDQQQEKLRLEELQRTKLLEEQQREKLRLEELQRTKLLEEQQREKLRLEELQRTTLLEEQQREKLRLEELQRTKLLEEQQREKLRLDELQKADQVVNQYAELIRTLHVPFGKLMTVELIEQQKNALLKQLGDITSNKKDLTQALKILGIPGQSPKINEAILTKAQEINSAAQQQHTVVELKLKEEQQRIQQLEEQQREKLRLEELQRIKLLEEQQKLKEAQQKAVQIVNQYAELIRTLPVPFGKLMTAELIEQQKNALLKQLSDITSNKENLTQALKILGIPGQSPKINAAILTKTQEINSAAQQQHTIVVLKQKEEQQRIQLLEEQQREKLHLEELQRTKLLEEQQREKQCLDELQKADQVVNQYAELIRTLHVPFGKLMTAELIEQQKNALLAQLGNITRNKEDLTQALKTLKITGQSPKINEAVLTKTQEINSAAQQQHTIVFKEHQQRQEQHQKQLKELELERRLREEEHQQQLKEQERERQHQQFIREEFFRINHALDTLQQRISRVDQHHSPTAFNNATSLLQDLQDARNDYSTALNQPGVIVSQAMNAFKGTCSHLIEDAKPLLENDLGWGDYLSNLLKTILNAVIWIGSFGQRNSFFPLERSSSIIAIEEAEQELVFG